MERWYCGDAYVTSQAPQQHDTIPDCFIHGNGYQNGQKNAKNERTRVFRFSTAFIDQVKETCTI